MPEQKPPRVSLFIPTLCCGGAERMTVNLARAMTQLGLPVDVVVSLAKGEFVNDVPAEANLIDLKAGKIRWSIRPLARYLKERKPYAMISRMMHTNILATAGRMLAGTQTKLILTEATHASRILTEGSLLRKFRQRYQVLPLAKWAYPRAEAVVAVSQGVADDLVGHIKKLPQPPHVIPNPVVDDRLEKLALEPTTHPWLEPEEIAKVPVVLAMGSMRTAKDFPTFLRAISRVRRKRQVRAIILGEGPDRPMLEGMLETLTLKRAVDMPGHCKNPYALLSKASLFALSSCREGSPNALTEAMACGCPVVSTDCPSGPMETLDGGRFGSLVPVGDDIALATAIGETLETSLPKETLQGRAANYSGRTAALRYLKLVDYPFDQIPGIRTDEFENIMPEQEKPLRYAA